MDGLMLASLTGIVGAGLAAIWSFLMAAKVAAPRAAKKSKLLLVNILTGATEEDRVILGTIQERLIRPEVARVVAEMQELEMPEINTDELMKAIGPSISTHIEMALHQAEAQQAKRVGSFLKDMDLEGQLGELEEGVKAQAMEHLPAQAQVLMDVMNTKVPKSASMTEKALMNVSKAVCAQLLQGGLAGLGHAPAVNEVKTVSTGFGVR